MILDEDMISNEEEYLPKTYLISIAVSAYGNNNFATLPNAVKDSEAIQKCLIPKYQVELHENLHDEAFTFQSLDDTFKRLSTKTQPQDAVLIFYNGHGEVDRDLLYWIPSHGKPSKPDTWIRADEIFSHIKGLDVAHVALIINCCEAGRIITQQSDAHKAHDISDNKSRLILAASKMNHNVSDQSETSEYSPFTEGVIRYFDENNDKIKLTLNELDGFIESTLSLNNNYKDPQLAAFGGYQVGRFPFHLTENDKTFWKEQEEKDTIESYSIYLGRFKKGAFRADAKKRQEELINERKEWLDTINKIKPALKEFQEKSAAIKGKFLLDVNTILATLETKETEQTKKQVIEAAWALIEDSDTLSDFEKFDKAHGANSFTSRSLKSQAKLKVEAAANKAWADISNKSKPEEKRNALNSFINDYPHDRRVGEAKEREEAYARTRKGQYSPRRVHENAQE